MLNPSTAGVFSDDPTSRKCITWATRWECNELIIVNMFAIVHTDSKTLHTQASPFGEFNYQFVARAAAHCVEAGGILVGGWGQNKLAQTDPRALELQHLLKGAGIKCFAINKDGSPKHPLYVAYNTPLRNLYERNPN